MSVKEMNRGKRAHKRNPYEDSITRLEIAVVDLDKRLKEQANMIERMVQVELGLRKKLMLSDLKARERQELDVADIPLEKREEMRLKLAERHAAWDNMMLDPK